MAAKLTKIAQKIFGSEAGLDQIGVFGSYFAADPTFTTDPEEVMSLSNWLTGWYAAVIGGNAPTIQDMNGAMFAMTYQLGYLMQEGVAEWDAETEYFEGSFVNATGVLYISRSDNNVNHAVSDTTWWTPYGTNPSGSGMDYFGPTAPAGYVFADGQTIGSASSNATNRANVDTFALFSLLWDNYSNTILPIYTSAGVLTVRGASATADFAANKAVTIIDKRGRVSAGKDDMNGTTPTGRLSNTTMSPDAITLGASGGAQTITLTGAQLGSHSHSVTDPGHTHTQNSHLHDDGTLAMYANNSSSGGTTAPTGHLLRVADIYTTLNNLEANLSLDSIQGNTGSTTATNNSNTTGLTTNNAGGDAPHNNVQPTIICNYIIKL